MSKEKPSQKLLEIAFYINQIRKLNLQLTLKFAILPTINEIITHIDTILEHYENLIMNLTLEQETFEEEYIPKFEEE